MLQDQAQDVTLVSGTGDGREMSRKTGEINGSFHAPEGGRKGEQQRQENEKEKEEDRAERDWI